ncbi:hypothetical protein Tco_1491541 [Tanacetum coccineum]
MARCVGHQRLVQSSWTNTMQCVDLLGERSLKRTLGTSNNAKGKPDETPFSLVCGTEAVIPIEVLIQTERVAMVTDDEKRKDSLRI